MEAYLTEWLALLVRWIHVIAGVAWIGASFYFIWLDNHLREPPEWKQQKGIKGDLWAIHGGGFYEIAKYRYGPERMPEQLHWFKWEAYSTLLSGMALLFVVYYLGSPGYLVDPAKADLTTGTAMAIGLGGIALVLALYEALIRSPLANSGRLFGLVFFLILILADWAYFQWFSGRGAFIHVGATIGTVMVANVFLGIIPSQKALVATVRANREPDARVKRLADLAKLRSTHNNYLTLPILFIMISNHYPSLYGHPHGWAILAAIGFITAFARHYFNLRHRGIRKPSILVASAVMGLALVWVLAPTPASDAPAASAPVSDSTVRRIVQTHCLGCHARHPSQPGFQAPPAGIVLEQPAQWLSHKAQILQAAVATQYMPLGNLTGMTEQERRQLGQWLNQTH
jgi:uncharacterized membrane protein